MRCNELCTLKLKDIKWVKERALKYPYEKRGPEYYAAELEAMDKAMAMKTENPNYCPDVNWLGF